MDNPINKIIVQNSDAANGYCQGGEIVFLMSVKKNEYDKYRKMLYHYRGLLKRQKAQRLYYDKCAWVERSNGKFVRFPIVGMWLDGVPSKPCLCRCADSGKEYGVIISTRSEKRGFNIL